MLRSKTILYILLSLLCSCKNRGDASSLNEARPPQEDSSYQTDVSNLPDNEQSPKFKVGDGRLRVDAALKAHYRKTVSGNSQEFYFAFGQSNRARATLGRLNFFNDFGVVAYSYLYFKTSVIKTYAMSTSYKPEKTDNKEYIDRNFAVPLMFGKQIGNGYEVMYRATDTSPAISVGYYSCWSLEYKRDGKILDGMCIAPTSGYLYELCSRVNQSIYAQEHLPADTDYSAACKLTVKDDKLKLELLAD